MLQLNEYGAEVVCRALKDATSCDKEKNQTCQSPIWQGNVNAATFVESAFYRTFCVLKQSMELKTSAELWCVFFVSIGNLKTCDFQDVSRCLAYLEDTSDKSLSAQVHTSYCTEETFTAPRCTRCHAALILEPTWEGTAQRLHGLL